MVKPWICVFEFLWEPLSDHTELIMSICLYCRRVMMMVVMTIILMKKLMIQWYVTNFNRVNAQSPGAGQWLSGRVLDSRPRGSGFEPHRRHCVVVLEQDTFILP